MRFPGNRNPKHYFPVTGKATRQAQAAETPGWYVVGIDQILVDAEVHVSDAFLDSLGLKAGESAVLDDTAFRRVADAVEAAGLQWRFAPGGTVANTINNYTWLSGEPAILLGAIEQRLEFGSPAFHYVAQSPRGMNLQHLKAADGRVGIALTLITPSGERTFAVAPGVANDLGPEDISEGLIEESAAVVTSLYTLSNPDWPIAQATRRALEVASRAGVPTAFGLGTAGLVEANREMLVELLRDHVTLAAMNDREALALTGLEDPFQAVSQILEWVDMAIVTQGQDGMVMGGWTDESTRRATRYPLRTGSIPEFNRWEFSRLVRRDQAPSALKCYTHMHPYKGGPDRLVNTNGAGDAALAAILHDVAANRYHQVRVPDSAKHAAEVPFLTYSSLSRTAQYGNRVAYEVLRGHSPRLDGPVGDDDDSQIET